MSKRTPTQDRAIAWFADEINAVPQLSPPGVIIFKIRDSDEYKPGEIVERSLEHLVYDYKRWKKQK